MMDPHPLSIISSNRDHSIVINQSIMTEDNLNALGYAKLMAKTPVPSDIEISHQIVKEIGLLPVADVAKQ
jgi:hypothetical protein